VLQLVRPVNRFSAILNPDDIEVDVEANGMDAVFAEAGRLFERRYGIPASTVVENLTARERLGSTGLGRGVAIPHGRIKGLEKPVAAVLRTRTAAPFGAPDGEPVFLLVFLLVPQLATAAHLEVLAEVAAMLSERAFREEVRRCADAASVYRVFAGWTSLSPASAT